MPEQPSINRVPPIFTAPAAWYKEHLQTDLLQCHLYNTMEAAAQWTSLRPQWEHLTIDAHGWMVPCEASLPYVGVVLQLELKVHQEPDTLAWNVTIPYETLHEIQPEFGRLLRIDVLPNLSHGTPGEEGYLFLPCYSGVIHRFSRTVAREERIVLYAAQEQWPLQCNFNCFGFHSRNASWSASVINGEWDAEVVARSHWEIDHLYSIHASLVYRWSSTESIIPGDRSIRYHFFSYERGGWAAFARTYRTYLRSECGMETLKERRRKNPAVSNLASGFLLKIFQGHKKMAFDGKGEYQSMTSFVEARSILEAMRNDGISRITTEMVGWNAEGHDGLYPQRFPINSVEGGEAGFRDLLAWGASNGIVVSVHDNCYDAYSNADNFDARDLVILRDGNIWRNVPWSGGFVRKICPTRGMRYLTEHYAKMKSLGVDGHYYLDALGAFYPCHSQEHPANRKEYLAAMRKLLIFTRQTFGTLNVEIPFGPYIDIIDGTYLSDSVSHLDAISHFRQQWIDEAVPFLSVVLHNSVRYQSSGGGKKGRARALRDLALGAMPFVEIAARPAPGPHRMPTYEDVREYAQSAWELSCVKFVDRIDVDIDSIVMIEPDVYETQYVDSVKITVNASPCPVRYGKNELPPLSVYIDSAAIF